MMVYSSIDDVLLEALSLIPFICFFAGWIDDPSVVPRLENNFYEPCSKANLPILR
jgi:hypothetical protein